MPIFNFGSRRQTVPAPAPTIAPGAEVRDAYIQDQFTGGRALKYPLERDQLGDWKSVSGLELATQKIIQVLATRAKTAVFPGEVEGTPEFGCKLHLLANRNLTETTRALAGLLTREAVELWVPEVILTYVNVILVGVDTDDVEAGISIEVQFKMANQRSTGEVAGLTLLRRS
jgi:phage baseplate assembly protein W